MNIREKKENKYAILIYFLMFFLLVCKVNFYAENVGRFPDEGVHISYIAYLEKTGNVIPEFENMTRIELVRENMYHFSDTDINYLGHPPLYYHIMRLSGGVNITEDTAKVDLDTLRNFSQLIAYIGIIIAFYIGYKAIDLLPLHLLYSGIIVSVPMLTYTMAGVNNDTLSFLGLSIVILALFKYKDGEQNFLTYLILSLGIFITMLSKLTAGLILIVALGIFITREIMDKKSLKFIFNKNMMLTLPLYLFVIIYFLIIFIKYRTVHPGLKTIAPDYFYTTGFYVEPAKRVIMTFKKYINYYWENFFRTWIGIHSHVSMAKTGSLFQFNSIGLLSIWFLPIMSFFTIKKTKYKNAFSYVYIGVLVASFVQFIRAYNGFIVNGYKGSYQSRYYLCALPAMAILICLWVKDRYEYIKKELVVQGKDTKVIEICFFLICLAFVGLLIYGDIIYFLINFNKYI